MSRFTTKDDFYERLEEQVWDTMCDEMREDKWDEKETIMNLLTWLSERHYLNETSIEYDYDEKSYVDVISLSPEDIYKEYIDWLEIEDN